MTGNVLIRSASDIRVGYLTVGSGVYLSPPSMTVRIESMRRRETQMKANHWWSVETVKPPILTMDCYDRSKEVLVWDGCTVEIASYYGDTIGWVGGNYHISVTHWTDLPEGPDEIPSDS